MIPVGPLFNHPHTYKPFSRTGGSLDVSLKTRPLMFGTTPGKKDIHQTWQARTANGKLVMHVTKASHN